MNKLFTTAALVCALSFGFTSCSKDDDNTMQVETPKVIKNLKNNSKTDFTQGELTVKNDIFSLKNFKQFAVSEDGKPTAEAAKIYYYNFSENDGTDIRTNMISLSGDTKVTVTANAANGYTLSYIDKTFNDVVATDKFTAISTNSSSIYKMKFGGKESVRSESGWCNYDGDNNHLVTAQENRTLIISKHGRPFFKLKMNSIYENEKANESANNFVFYSIDYQEFK